MHTRAKGQQGETLAADYLTGRHYRLIARNFFTRLGEIDIVAIDESINPPELVFIEVKTRGSHQFGQPEDALNELKWHHFSRTAQIYLEKNPWPGFYRFDCLAIALNYQTRLAQVKHFKNIG